MKLLGRFLGLVLIMLCLQACDNTSAWQRFLSVQYWSAQREAKVLLEQGLEAERQGNLPFAIGKYRKAYRLSPEDHGLPLVIARLYAQIAQQDPHAEFEKQQSIDWLYRAYLIDPDFAKAPLDKPPFTALKGAPIYTSLLVKLGKAPTSEQALLNAVHYLTAVVTETTDVVREIGRTFNGAYRIAEGLGFQVVAFLLCIALFGIVLRNLGFLFGWPLWALSIAMTVALWHYGFRIASGGQSGGWEPMMKILEGVAVFAVVFVVLRSVLRFAAYEGRKAWKTSVVCEKLERSAIAVRWRGWRKNSGSLEAWEDRDVRRYLFELEEAQEQLRESGYRYLSTQNIDERRHLSLDLESLRRKIHELTGRPSSS